jgi:hypothetical protein
MLFLDSFGSLKPDEHSRALRNAKSWIYESIGSRLPGAGLKSAHSVLATEFVHATAGVDDLLLAGIKRVARGAHFDVEFLAERRARFKFVAATTDDLDGFVIARERFSAKKAA